jgi:polysaccharide pyruvyl transferase WcaK-like protein
MKSINIAHIGIHKKANLNSGDTLLFSVVRDIFKFFLDDRVEWTLYQLWEEFSEEQIKLINKYHDGIVIGGGGLLLKDQLGSNIKNSGWQWNCSSSVMQRIEIPLIIFAIGYNKFRGQEDFDKNFYESMNMLSSKSEFLSLRNNGSIESLKKYLNNANLKKNKITRQLCPTTLISKINNKFALKSAIHENKGKKILSFNAAFDRRDMRFNNPEEKFLEACELMKFAQEKNWIIQVCSHKDMDREIEGILKSIDVDFIIKDLTRSSPNEIMEHYSQIDLSIGMRKHSQMIPFGLNKPIFSLISHDEVKYFLDDIGLPQYGVDMSENGYSKPIKDFLLNFDDNRANIINILKVAQEEIWKETQENFEIIKSLVS